MRRALSRNAKIALGVLPLLVGCALATEGDPPPPIPNEGGGGEGDTGGTGVGGTGLGGTSTGGVSGSTPTGGASGTATGGTTPTGGTGGSTSTGGTGSSAGKGGTAGAMTGGSAGSGMTGGSAGKGGSAGTGGTGGSAGKGGSAGTGGTNTGGKGGSGGGAAGGPPGGMELFRDNFEMGAANWTATPTANWAIATDGTMVYAATGASANSTWRAGAAGEPTWTDVQLDARVKVTSFAGMSTSYYAGVCVRYTSNSSYACFTLRSDGKIAFRVNGNNTASATPAGGDITPGTWYTVRVVARGANITAFLNGTEIAAGSRVTTGAPATGRIALAAPGTNVVFDDIVVSTP